MGSHITSTIYNRTTKCGTNAKAIVNWFIENAGLNIVECPSDTEGNYLVYLGIPESTDVLIRIESSNNSWAYIYGLVGHQSGQYTVNGKNYSLAAGSSSDVSGIVSDTQSYTVGVIRTDSAIWCRINSTWFGFAKFKDDCSGKLLYGTQVGVGGYTSWTVSDGANYSGMGGWGYSEGDNGYIRVYPLGMATSSLNFVGHLINPEDFCVIPNFHGTIDKEYVIAGHTFVCVRSNNAYYAKLN